MGIERPLPSSPFFSLSSDFFDDDGMKRFERRRLLRDVVGVEVGVGRSLEVSGATVVVMLLASLPDDEVEVMEAVV